VRGREASVGVIDNFRNEELYVLPPAHVEREEMFLGRGPHESGTMRHSVPSPFSYTQKLTLAEILERHPKGIAYGGIVKPFKKYPVLTDSSGRVLSFPPIINSNDLGAVQVGDHDLLVEFTGSDILALALSANIVACDFADSGYAIKPVRVDYDFDTPLGRSVVFPYYFQVPATVDAGLQSLTITGTANSCLLVNVMAATSGAPAVKKNVPKIICLIRLFIFINNSKNINFCEIKKPR